MKPAPRTKARAKAEPPRTLAALIEASGMKARTTRGGGRQVVNVKRAELKAALASHYGIGAR